MVKLFITTFKIDDIKKELELDGDGFSEQEVDGSRIIDIKNVGNIMFVYSEG